MISGESNTEAEEDKIPCSECDDYERTWSQKPIEVSADLYEGLHHLIDDKVDPMSRSVDDQIALEGGMHEDEYLVEWATKRGLTIEDPDLLLHKKSDLALAYLKKLGYSFVEI